MHASILIGLALTGCSGDDELPPAVAEFGWEDERSFDVIGTEDDGLEVPRDLAFNPAYPDQLWVVNQATDSTTIYFDAGTADQDVEHLDDVWGEHFMEEVSSIAFDESNQFGTCQESYNTYNDTTEGDGFMGPTLWDADLDIYAEVNQGMWGALLGSHIDMLHMSPYCMGIAWDYDNVYWVFDGNKGHIVRYDFQEDHGPGYDDHSDGIVRRYTEAEVSRVEGVPGHMVLDHETGWLYVADTGNGRVIRLDTNTGEWAKDLVQTVEPLEEYSRYEGATVEIFANGLTQPSGIALYGDTLFVGDYGTGDIRAYNLDGEELDLVNTEREGLMGLTVSPDGQLFFVDAEDYQVVRLDPTGNASDD
ncbi:MAG: hypothetical protein QGG40_06665 [Myxococcota bacterium]|nr:hypothetical protein [Myxococcota bacterium]